MYLNDQKTFYYDLFKKKLPGVDPGFPEGWAPTLAGAGGGGRQHAFLPEFPKNYMKLRKVGAVAGGVNAVEAL